MFQFGYSSTLHQDCTPTTIQEITNKLQELNTGQNECQQMFSNTDSYPSGSAGDSNFWTQQHGPVLSVRVFSSGILDSVMNTYWFHELSSYIWLEKQARADFSDSRKRSRPYSHLQQARTLWNNNIKTSNDKKVQHILDIWSDRKGVVCLHIFQNVIPAEAYTYEAAMIAALGLTRLQNIKPGNYYGTVASWPKKYRHMLGRYLLYKAMLIFLSEGERQLRPDDLD
ncbi:unnamed protein product [Spodoptera littoralis]|uniref:Uncharacterized protein n=1 Tax=Spodoptera littoralis TaxID=7109 RepID=A0A9P0I5R1_SPOLI|nr:unnamed protein product [Spodoptera littoralis]CAH1640397.1 unnamed protein product [Spodoptera littoralis]